MEKAAGKHRDLSRTRPRFFKVFLPQISSQRLICPAFKKRHLEGKRIGKKFTLTGPSKNVWEVDLVMEGNGRLFLSKGWSDFAKAHALQFGEFLVFEYDGNTNFSVILLDVTGCDKVSAFQVEHRPCEEPQGGGNGKAAKAVEVEEVFCPVSCINEERGEDEEEEEMLKVNEKKKRKWGVGRRAAFELSKMRKKRKEEKKDGLCAKRGKSVLMSRRRRVLEKEIKRAHKAAFSFQSNKPCCPLIMRKSNVYTGHNLRIPIVFAEPHLGDTEELILRGTRGRKWHVTLVNIKAGTFISAGWRKFSFDNNLEEDDACVFELVRENEMVVHIFRIVEEVMPVSQVTIYKR